MKICSVENCNKKFLAKGLCSLHYQRFKDYGDPLYEKPKKYCSIAGCNNPYDAIGYCGMHAMGILIIR